MADDEFPGHLSGPDVDLFLSGCFSDPLSWSEMRRRFAILSVFVFLWAAPAFSQGCAMCRSSAEPTAWISGIEKRWEYEVRNRVRHFEVRRVVVEVWPMRRIA